MAILVGVLLAAPVSSGAESEPWTDWKGQFIPLPSIAVESLAPVRTHVDGQDLGEAPARPTSRPSKSAQQIQEAGSVRIDPPVTSGRPSGGGIRGGASWYCLSGRSVCHHAYPDGGGADLYAAAGPALRTGSWRGRTVTVCANACVTVKLIDWCACPGGRVIDLYADAFKRLAPLSQGTVSVRVTS